MSGLISGKDALIALANGEEVEYKSINGRSDVKHLHAHEFLGVGYEFRLKPRTITINGIEVPAPFEPKEAETYWFITDSECGYNCVENKQGCRVGIAAWRTEEEIKQVVAALRRALGGNHD